MNLQLSISITNNPRTWPIIDGTVKPDGIDLIPTVLHPSELFWRQLHFSEFAVSEMSCSSFMIVTGQGDPRFLGLPIFTTRRFFHTTILVSRKSGIEKPADLKGKTITVMSYQDTTFYALLGLLASAGLTKDDVDIQSAGPVGVWQMVATGKSAGMAGVPDWIPPVEAAGVAIKVIPTDEFFPHMAQAVAASDDTIKNRPELVRAFVKAALHGMKDIMDDPDKAAVDFVKFVPEWTGKECQVKEAFAYYDKLIYPGQKVLGAVDPNRVAKLQDFYLAKGIIQKKSPVDDLYTNQFVE